MWLWRAYGWWFCGGAGFVVVMCFCLWGQITWGMWWLVVTYTATHPPMFSGPTLQRCLTCDVSLLSSLLECRFVPIESELSHPDTPAVTLHPSVTVELLRLIHGTSRQPDPRQPDLHPWGSPPRGGCSCPPGTSPVLHL